MDAVLHNFRRSFDPSTPFFHSMSLDPPTTIEELYRRVDRYSTLEDNICTATQTVIITIQPTERNKLVGKKSPEIRKIITKIESDPVISHKKRGRSSSSPAEHLIREAATPHSRLARFQVAGTDPDGSLLEKPFRAVRLS